MKPLVLLFDLDGTLTDPKPGIVRCMKHALDKLGAPCPLDDTLASFIGPSLRETFATLLDSSDQSVRSIAKNTATPGSSRTRSTPASPRCCDAARGIASASFVATLKPKLSMPTESCAGSGSNHTLPVSMVPS